MVFDLVKAIKIMANHMNRIVKNIDAYFIYQDYIIKPDQITKLKIWQIQRKMLVLPLSLQPGDWRSWLV